MGLKYQRQDFEVVDYQLYSLPGIQDHLRGPAPAVLNSGRYVSFLGSAHTFGTFSPIPYPTLTGAALSVGVLNLGLAGAGPDKFLNQDRVFEYVNGGLAAVVQVMPGRSAPNRLLTNPLGGSMFRRTDGPADAPLAQADEHFARLLSELPQAQLLELVAETRRNWVASMRLLLERIRVPKLLLWFAQRQPKYDERLDSVQALFGPFPQLVNQEMIEALKPCCDQYAEAVTPQRVAVPLRSRFTGAPSPVQRDHHLMKAGNYYPSQLMHIAASLEVARALSELLREPAPR